MSLSPLFSSFYTREGLLHLDAIFFTFLSEKAPSLEERLKKARQNPETLSSLEESQLLIDLAPPVEDFLETLGGMASYKEEREKKVQDSLLFQTIKRNFVQRYAIRLYPGSPLEKEEENPTLSLESWMKVPVTEETFVSHVARWLEAKEAHPRELEAAARYAAWRVATAPSVLFSAPASRDPHRLIPQWERKGDRLSFPDSYRRDRRGFSLTDPGLTSLQGQNEAFYCLLCHSQKKDSCRTGLTDKKTGDFLSTPQGHLLQGCPLDQKISEMNWVKREGYTLSALGIIMVDNPMVAATGHRICNDCMKSCIFQKQDPVQIPGLETQILKEVLSRPGGWELYSLLSRWNPFNIRRPLPKPPSGYKVLVVGLGPAGFTLAHHLLNEGHQVIAIDGMKIEPLPPALLERTPLLETESFFQDLNHRKSQGFGGVAEYGITVRWDKNFLTLLRPLLERRDSFQLWGGIRFGSTFTLEEAFEMGFDHVALCLGAGKPKTLSLKDTEKERPSFPAGVRSATDFLMALHSGGAGRPESLTSLQIQLPLVVIGGGLTAIDAATEALAYYGVQVETFLKRYTLLCQHLGAEKVRSSWTPEEKETADRFLHHGTLLSQTTSPGQRLQKLQEWGGVILLYHKFFEESASYRLNHEEVRKALEEGIQIEDNQEAQAYVVREGILQGLRVKHRLTGQEKEIPARTILTAVGTHHTHPILTGKTLEGDSPFLKNLPQEGKVSVFGDTHPFYSGSVVKAMASAKKGYPFLTQALQKGPPRSSEPFSRFKARLQERWVPHLQTVTPLSPDQLHLTFQAPAAVESSQPRHFFKLQTFESSTLEKAAPLPTLWASEPIPMSPVEAHSETGHLSFNLHVRGASTRILAQTLLQNPSQVFCMGPVGQAAAFPFREKVACLGEPSSLLRLQLLLKSLVEKENQVWVLETEKDSPLGTTLQEKFPTVSFVPFSWEQSLSEKNFFPLSAVEWLWAVGSPTFLHFVSEKVSLLRKNMPLSLKTRAGALPPLQCMMQGVCGQCLHLTHDPSTGESQFVFACQEPDQPLEAVDWLTLQKRLSQNSLLEKLAALWTETYLVSC